MRQRRSSCGCTVNHDEVKDEMRSETQGARRYITLDDEEKLAGSSALYSSRGTHPPLRA